LEREEEGKERGKGWREGGERGARRDKERPVAMINEPNPNSANKRK
jgi:hypothetical protein